MINTKELKQTLTLEDYRFILNDIGAIWKENHDDYWILKTGCHNLNWEDGSYKLYFYLDSKTFNCFTECSCSMDIFDLIKKRWTLEGKHFNFGDIVRYIADLINYKQTNSPRAKMEWKEILSIYKNPQLIKVENEIYNKDVLKVLKPYYHSSFLKDNISIHTMQKFNIAYYPIRHQITIPVYDEDGNLLGIHCRNLNQNVINRGYKYLPLKLMNGEEYNFKTNNVLYGLNLNKYNIEQSQRVLIFESPKSVLQLDTYFHNSNSVALFGMHLNVYRRNLLLNLELSEVVICLDKQYQQVGDDEWNAYCQRVVKIAKLFKGYCKITAVVDEDNLLSYKDSPTDKGKDVWVELFQNRKEIIC